MLQTGLETQTCINDSVLMLDISTMQIFTSKDILFDLGDNKFVFEWFAGINCIILWSQI